MLKTCKEERFLILNEAESHRCQRNTNAQRGSLREDIEKKRKGKGSKKVKTAPTRVLK